MKIPATSEPSSRRALSEGLWVGGISAIIIAVLALGRTCFGWDATELAVGFLMFHAALIVNDPHFAVTFLLFYGRWRRRLLVDGPRAQRVGNWIAGVAVPLLLTGWIATSLIMHSQPLLGALLQLMFFLVGWHYAKQGFGVFLILSARSGVRYTSTERLVLLTHCHAGWLYAWAEPADPGTPSVVHGVFYRSLAHPGWLELVGAVAFGASALAVAWVLWRKWKRERQRPPAAALWGLGASIWLWMVFSRVEPLFYYALPAMHSLQYLFFVWLMRRSEAQEQEAQLKGTVKQRLTFLAVSSVALGWLLLKGGPTVMDEAFSSYFVGANGVANMGPTPLLASFVAFVNIHHYALDAVLWRRSNSDTRHLLGVALPVSD